MCLNFAFTIYQLLELGLVTFFSSLQLFIYLCILPFHTFHEYLWDASSLCARQFLHSFSNNNHTYLAKFLKINHWHLVSSKIKNVPCLIPIATVSLLCCGNRHRVAIQIVDIILLAPVLHCIHAESLTKQVPIQDSSEKKRVRE